MTPLDVARTQIGVVELPGNRGVPFERYALPGEDPLPWCARFLRWCYLQAGLKDKAIRELKALLAAEPRLSAPRLKLGLILYNSHHIAEAVDQWENVLRFDAKNQDALRYLKMAQTAGVTTLNM